MVVVRNNFIPVKGFAAINICGVIFVRNGVVVSEWLLNHERIHTRQMVEMLVVGFYLWYVVEWLVRTIGTLRTLGALGTNVAYLHISFEREAYGNEAYPDYLKKRKMFDWLKYL